MIDDSSVFSRYKEEISIVWDQCNPELVVSGNDLEGLGEVQIISVTHLSGHDFRKGVQFIKNLLKKSF